MPNPATHLIVPLVLADIWRDYFAKRKFKLFYILVAGIAGLFPDIDVAIAFFVRMFSNIPFSMVHRQFTHTLFIPLLFLAVALLWRKNKKALLLFGAISFGIFIHLLLDIIIQGSIMPFYPLSGLSIGLNLLTVIGLDDRIFFAVLDGVILAAWLIHEYLKHKIRDFI
ncbi:MAG: metal-dependent hydrolase [Nanoarchaeota archaeon]